MNLRWSQSMHRSTKVLGAVVLSAALFAGCTSKPADNAAQTAEPQLKTVKVAPIQKSKISDPLEQVADVVSSIQIDVITKTGGDVMEIVKKRGDMVEKGDVILRLDPTDVQIQKEKTQIGLSGSQQQLVKAKQDLEDSKLELQNGIKKLELSISEAQKTYSKMHNDYDQGLVTKYQLEQTETQLSNLKLDLENSRNKLKTLETTNSLAQLEQGMQTAAVSLKEIEPYPGKYGGQGSGQRRADGFARRGGHDGDDGLQGGTGAAARPDQN
ncbi:biotin/lipoyl-binding protein [Paenibacillus sp. TAB 01]|uniref:biotin/lipoyl-binding protein n=1 Tax=Paenibacillus sp. TAB 01 TaxID=3368988 RepID=UPI0037538C95